jgi:hypothetical protein
MEGTAARRLSFLNQHLAVPPPRATLLNLEMRTENCRQPQPQPAAAEKPKPKLAIICTVWYYLTHAQHEGDRFVAAHQRIMIPSRRR